MSGGRGCCVSKTRDPADFSVSTRLFWLFIHQFLNSAKLSLQANLCDQVHQILLLRSCIKNQSVSVTSNKPNKPYNENNRVSKNNHSPASPGSTIADLFGIFVRLYLILHCQNARRSTASLWSTTNHFFCSRERLFLHYLEKILKVPTTPAKVMKAAMNMRAQ